MSRTRTVAAMVAVAGLLWLPDLAGAHMANPFTGTVKYEETKIVDRDTVAVTLIVTNRSSRARRARCLVEAYSGTQDTTVSKTVSLRVPPYRKGAGYHWAEERLRLNFPDGPIKPVSVTVPHCHRA